MKNNHATVLLADLRQLGCTVTLSLDGKVLIAPPSLLLPEDRVYIARHRDALAELLRKETQPQP